MADLSKYGAGVKPVKMEAVRKKAKPVTNGLDKTKKDIIGNIKKQIAKFRKNDAKRAWFVEAGPDEIYIQIKAGMKPIEFAKGNDALGPFNSAQVIPAFEAIAKDIDKGEFDAAIKAAKEAGKRGPRKAKK